MRYIILNKSISFEEVKSRKKYIEKVTNLYFIIHKIDEGVKLESFPSSSIDCLFLVGHNFSVGQYLKNNNIIEKNIVVVSCFFNIDNEMYINKKLYVSYDSEGKTDYYDGADWNLNFNVSKEELKLINSSGPFMERVIKYFRRII